MATFETPLTTNTTNGSISSKSESPNPVTYSTHTYHENNTLPAGGTQVTVVHSAGATLPSSELAAQDNQQQQQQSDYLATAGQTALKYLPTRVVNALGVGPTGTGGSDDKPSLPSHGHTFKPSRGGVGSLPGNLSEVSVAKLPEERALEEQVGKPLGRDGAMGTIADPQNVDSLPVKTINNPSSTINPSSESAAQFSDPIVEPYPPSGDGVALQHLARPDVPSTEHSRPLPTLISGNLTPGMESEPQTTRTTGHEDGEHGTLKSNHGTNVIQESAIGSEKDVSGPGRPFSDNASHARQAQKPRTEEDTSKSYATDQAARRVPKTSPGEGHKESLNGIPRAEDTKDQPQTDKSLNLDNASSTGASRPSDQENKQRKPSISQKIKGEVKVLTGKLSNDQVKVESGQALKKGLST